MTWFRFYELGPDGRIRRAADIEALDDREAIGLAAEMAVNIGAELWQGTRRVASLGLSREQLMAA